MRTGFIAIAILAFAGAGCMSKKTEAPSVQPRSEAEAEAYRASQAKGRANVARPREKGDPAAQTALVAPQPIAPANGSEFDQFPRKTTLKWSPVTGAVAYKVEVEYQSPDGQWQPAVAVKEVKDTEYEFDFIGAQPGRWHVWAVDANGQEGPKSDWWTFHYTK